MHMTSAPLDTEPVTGIDSHTIRKRIAKERFREWVLFDNRFTRALLAALTCCTALFMLSIGRNARGTVLLAQTHRAAFLGPIDRAIERIFKSALSDQPKGLARKVRSAIESFPFTTSEGNTPTRFRDDPRLLVNGCSLVLKSPRANEKGVLYLYYSYVYPCFMKYFDMKAISQRYRIVLEPSWSGFCDMNILCLAPLLQPVLVGAGETRDARFLRTASTTLIPGDFTGNTWVNTELFRPLPEVRKDLDVVVVAAWSWYKRHWAIFRALRTLRQRGHVLKVGLAGYQMDMSAADILAVARYYGVDDQLELHDGVSQADVNRLFNRAKVNLLWSRREGSNRSISEGMAADVPFILREGFNYGETYPHITPGTGRFADESDLPDVLLDMINHPRTGTARDWMIKRMTPVESTRRMNESLKAIALREGEAWTTDAVIKVSHLSGLGYLDPEDESRFQADHDFLVSSLIGSTSTVSSDSTQAA